MRRALDEALWKSLQPLLLVLIVMYGVLAALKPWLVEAHAPLLAGWELVMVAAYGSALWFVRRRPGDVRWAHALGTGIASLILIDSILHLVLRAEPLETLSFILLSLGVAFFFTSIPWFALMVAAIGIGWATATASIPPFAGWIDLVVAMFEGIALSGAIFAVRLRMLRRLETMRARDALRTVELQGTLEDLGRREAQLAQAQEIAHVGSWEWDVLRDRVLWSDELYKIFGLPGGGFDGTLAAFLARVHPEDRARVGATVQHSLEGRKSFRYDARVMRPDGTVRLIASHGEVVVTDARVTRMIGVCQDVTELKATQRRLAVQHTAAHALASGEAEVEVIGEIARGVCTAIGWRSAAYWAIDEAAGELRCVGVWSVDPGRKSAFDEAIQRSTFARGVGIPGRVWETGKAVWTTGPDAEPGSAHADLAAGEGIRGAVAFPVGVSSRVLGVFEFYRASADEVDRDLLEILDPIGLQLGLFIERGRTREAAAFQSALLEAQTEASLDGILVVGGDGRMILFNRRFVQMWGIPHDVIESRSDEAALAAVANALVAPEEFRARVQYLYEHPEVESREEIRLKDGRVFDRYSAPILAEGKHMGRVWYFRDITNAKKAEAALRDQRDDLQKLTKELSAANKELESFGYTISHDLKAPTRAVAFLAQVLREDQADRLDASGKETIERLLTEAGRMTRLVEDLLELSRTTAGEVLRRGNADLSALALDALRELREREPDREVEARVAPGVVAEGDARFLQVVLQNLLGNAWKYTSRTQTARIEFGRSPLPDGGVAYYVRDNGAGFEPAAGQLLFQPFKRIHGKDFPGTGIGLTTVRRIVERHGGRVWAESPGPGHGATFWFTL